MLDNLKLKDKLQCEVLSHLFSAPTSAPQQYWDFFLMKTLQNNDGFQIMMDLTAEFFFIFGKQMLVPKITLKYVTLKKPTLDSTCEHGI